MKNKALILDRDGVINRVHIKDGKPYPPKSVSELEILPDVSNALRELKKLGYLLIVVTNQPDVGRGTQERKVVEKIHDALTSHLPLDAIYTCYHGNDGECECRKPKPGMLKQASLDYNIDLSKSFLVGDRWKDIDAGNAVGCCTFYIDNGYKETKPINFKYKISSISELIDIIDY